MEKVPNIISFRNCISRTTIGMMCGCGSPTKYNLKFAFQFINAMKLCTFSRADSFRLYTIGNLLEVGPAIYIYFIYWHIVFSIYFRIIIIILLRKSSFILLVWCGMARRTQYRRPTLRHDDIIIIIYTTHVG